MMNRQLPWTRPREADYRAGTRLVHASLVALILVVALSTPALAATPQPIVIATHVDFSGQVNVGTFTTVSGPLCPSGSFVDSIAAEGGSSSGAALNVLVRRTFACADGSGTFDVQLHVQFLPSGSPGSAGGAWTGMGGSGTYAGLAGAGTFSVVIDPSSATGVEAFTGFVVL